jgi:tetratricopeptide (TPR) repeat protein
LGRDTEAVETSEKAARLDPLSLPISASLGTVYFASRQYDKAEAQCMKVIEMDSSFAMARSILANVYIDEGSYDKAIHELEAIVALPTSTPEDLVYLGYGYARGGRVREARQILARLSDRTKQHYVPACFFALIHEGLGENEEMSKWLEKAYQDRDFYLEGFAQLIDYRPGSVDPRIDDILRRMGLNPRSATTRLQE